MTAFCTWKSISTSVCGWYTMSWVVCFLTPYITAVSRASLSSFEPRNEWKSNLEGKWWYCISPPTDHKSTPSTVCGSWNEQMRTVNLPVVKLILAEHHKFQMSYYSRRQINWPSLIDINRATLIYSVQTSGLSKKWLKSCIKRLELFWILSVTPWLLFIFTTAYSVQSISE